MAQVKQVQSYTQRYWRALLPEIIGIVLLSGLAGLVGWGWLQHYHRHLQSMQAERQRLQAKAVAEQQAQAYQALWVQHQTAVTRWQTAGWLRADLIPHWVATWPAIVQRQSLVDVRYHFAPQHACQPADWPVKQPSCAQMAATLAPGLQVSRMTVNFSLDHEMQLLPWLQALQSHYWGATLLRQCDWTAHQAQTTIEVVCSIDWFYLPIRLANVTSQRAS